MAGFHVPVALISFFVLVEEKRSRGRNRDTILGDAFEAFLGALLLDKGEKTVEEFIHKVMIPRLEKGILSV